MSADSDLLAHRPLKTLELLVLVVLQEGGPLHGYGMVQRIRSLSEGVVRVRPGDLYRVLYRLQKRGLLESSRGEANERRSLYALTPLGQRVLRAEARMLRTIVAGVGRRKRESHA